MITTSSHGAGATSTRHEYPPLQDAGPFASLFTVAQAACVRDFWFGGKDNFAIDRIPAAKVAAAAEWLPAGIRAGRCFVLDAVAAAVEDGLDQILDIGTGLPLQPYLHTVAWETNRKVRVAYVPDGPIPTTHARAILARHSGTTVLDSELATPQDLLTKAGVVLDLARPAIVVMDGVLEQVPDAQAPADLVGELHAGLAAGSRLIVTHITTAQDLLGDRHGATLEAIAVYNAAVVPPLVPRSPAELHRLLGGFDLAKPGVAALSRSGAAAAAGEEPLPVLAAVGIVRSAGMRGGR